MALVTDRCVFLHIPKCSGIWIRHVFKVCKIPHIELGEQHSHFPEIARYQPEQFFKDRLLFSFVRHPLTWYQSRWAFRVKHGWKAQHPLDYNCASNDFRTFVDNVLRYKPSGWLTWECQSFIDQCPRPIDFVGRMENIVEDTIKVLTMAGEKFSAAAVRSCPRVNDSDMDGKSSKYWAPYNELLAKRVMAVESEVIARYYSGFDFNPKSLYHPRPY